MLHPHPKGCGFRISISDINRSYIDDNILKYFSENISIEDYKSRFLAEQNYIEFKKELNQERRRSGQQELCDNDIVNFIKIFAKSASLKLLNP